MVEVVDRVLEQNFEQGEVEIRAQFDEIVSQIAQIEADELTDFDKEQLSATPIKKPAGRSDQGYRED